MADGFNRRGKPRAESRKIKRTRALVDLDGIAAAHGDVGLRFAVEVGEFAASAAAADRVTGNFHGLEATGPDVGGDNATVESVSFSGKDF